MTIDILKKYDINIEDYEMIDMLISETKYAQIRRCETFSVNM